MLIKCTLSVSLKNIAVFAAKLSELPPLPGYITRRGPSIHRGIGGDGRIDTIYEFDESRLAEAQEFISNHLDLFRDIPGFSFSAHPSTVFSESKDKQPIRLESG
jgi:hypothetical protein